MSVSENSKLAFKKLHDLGKRQLEVYWFIKAAEARGSHPCNADIADGLGLPLQSITGRVKELKDYGYLKVHGKKTGRYGSPVDTLCTSDPNDKKLFNLTQDDDDSDEYGHFFGVANG